jgi:hypothetical protein
MYSSVISPTISSEDVLDRYQTGSTAVLSATMAMCVRAACISQLIDVLGSGTW